MVKGHVGVILCSGIKSYIPHCPSKKVETSLFLGIQRVFPSFDSYRSLKSSVKVLKFPNNIPKL